ncbi:MAG TPA: hypothetical protein VF798_04530 [Burkholderiaceae bacterium]
MAVTILPGAEDGLLELQDHMLSQWDLKLWPKAENEMFDKLDTIGQGMIKGLPIRELVRLGDTYVYLVAAQKRNFKSLLFRRLMSSS